MAVQTIRCHSLSGLNVQLNPLTIDPSESIRQVNVDSYDFGAKHKRPGYETYLDTADGQQVNSLFTWTKNDGTTNFTYRASGSSLYYSIGGTAEWSLCGNGTIGNGAYVDYAVLDNTLMVCDGVGSTRHSTDGTSFTNTTLAPVAVSLAQFQNRIYAAGTASSLFYSASGTATDWNPSDDSSSLAIPGAGKLLKIFRASDRIIATKNSGLVYRWDGYNLVDQSTDHGPTSAYSVKDHEGYYYHLNRIGLFSYNGADIQILSNKIQKQIYNNSGGGIVDAYFGMAPAAMKGYNYLLGAGTVTEDLTNETVSNAVIKYNVQLNELSNYSLYDNPTAMSSYVSNGEETVIFGDKNGQCYKFVGTSTSDNGHPIESVLEYVFTAGSFLEKEFKWLRLLFNLGCQAKVQVAVTDTFVKGKKNWIDLGDVSTGVANFRFIDGANRGRLLFIKIYDASRSPGFDFYGYEVDFDYITV